jgi:hypothetical protein
MKEFEQVIQIRPQEDAFDDVRMEYAKMLKQQLAKGNNGLVKSKYITFAIEAENIREAKPKLERIESDILNNFKILGVPAYPLNGVERLQILYETFNPDVMTDFQFDYGSMIRTGLNTKDYVAPTSSGTEIHSRWEIPSGLSPICRSWRRSLRIRCWQNFWILIRT